MNAPLFLSLAIISFAAAFHLHWALGGRLGYSVSLPQREDGDAVMAKRLGWWRWGAAGVVLALMLLAALALTVAGSIQTPLEPGVGAWILRLVGASFVLRAMVPTRWTGFFKKIRSTRWARFDTWLYSPLFLILGLSLIAIAAGY
jgi:hypothetical protein